MSALTEAPWYQFSLDHIEVAVHRDVFGDALGNDIDPRTDEDIQRAILVMIGASVGRQGLRWHQALGARLRRPTQDERLYLLELVLRDREADGLVDPEEGWTEDKKRPLIFDFIVEMDYRPRRQSGRRRKAKTKPQPAIETAFFAVLWPESPGQPLIYSLPTEEVEQKDQAGAPVQQGALLF